MRILLTNDDGIWAPGLRAMYDELRQIEGVELEVVAPAVNQSGVGHSITFLEPLIVQEAFLGEAHFGWEVAGSPADCVKLAMLELCPQPPDLVVSGINSGSNAGINVLYSGTVAAAIEGAFFDVTSIAVSLSMTTHPDYLSTARQARGLIERLVREFPKPGLLWNINFPESTPEGPRGVKFVAMQARRYNEFVEKRTDPRGRTYYWSGADRQLSRIAVADCDVAGLVGGYVTITPLHFDLTARSVLQDCAGKDWQF